MVRSKLEKALVGPAGEHYTLYRLHMLGIMAAQAPRNAPTVDVLIFGDDDSVVAALQVKTRSIGADGGWHMSKKHESMRSPRLFYAFVDFEPSAPRTYVVPSAAVADVLTRSHKA
jgi:hypothetical protein